MKRLHFILFRGRVRTMSKSLQADIPVSKSAGRPKAADAEARMHDLVHTAGMLFLKNGYTKVSLESIARQAHVAVRTIYVKFGGKAGLLGRCEVSRDLRVTCVHGRDDPGHHHFSDPEIQDTERDEQPEYLRSVGSGDLRNLRH